MADVRVRVPSDVGSTPRSDGRPVLLVTMDVPFDGEATVVAVDAAVEAGQPLIIVNVVELAPLPLSIRMGYDQLEYPPDLDASLRAPAELAAALGIRVERLRVRSPHPVQALLQVARERRPGLVVFGPDRRRLSRRRYGRAVKALREDGTWLLWFPG